MDLSSSKMRVLLNVTAEYVTWLDGFLIFFLLEGDVMNFIHLAMTPDVFSLVTPPPHVTPSYRRATLYKGLEELFLLGVCRVPQVAVIQTVLNHPMSANRLRNWLADLILAASDKPFSHCLSFSSSPNSWQASLYEAHSWPLTVLSSEVILVLWQHGEASSGMIR